MRITSSLETFDKRAVLGFDSHTLRIRHIIWISHINVILNDSYGFGSSSSTLLRQMMPRWALTLLYAVARLHSDSLLFTFERRL